MNTFFFGYLSLKWRRLVRTISIIYLIFNFLYWTGELWGEFPEFFIFISLFSIPIPLISWVLKPFIVKEKS